MTNLVLFYYSATGFTHGYCYNAFSVIIIWNQEILGIK